MSCLSYVNLLTSLWIHERFWQQAHGHAPKLCKLSTRVTSVSRHWPSWPTGSSDLDLQTQCFYLATISPCWTFNSSILWCHHSELSHLKILNSNVFPVYWCPHLVHGGVQILDSSMLPVSIPLFTWPSFLVNHLFWFRHLNYFFL